MLYIDPEACVDCDACVAECPVEAIFREDEVPERWRHYVALNAEMARNCPPIVERKEPMAPPDPHQTRPADRPSASG
ncbi:MAG TPA: 4Fe-4S binding protein [Gemmataceae bacterium]|nr:4Fe-4S binding protein [Gemmataceae bacterium]